MDYLTKYYKNLSEQLQEKVNFLQRQLNEGNPFTAPRQPSSSSSGSGLGRSSRSVSLGTPKPRQQGGDLVWVEEVPETKPKPKQGGDLVWVEEVPDSQKQSTPNSQQQSTKDALAQYGAQQFAKQATDLAFGGIFNQTQQDSTQQQPPQSPQPKPEEKEESRTVKYPWMGRSGEAKWNTSLENILMNQPANSYKPLQQDDGTYDMTNKDNPGPITPANWWLYKNSAFGGRKGTGSGGRFPFPNET